MIYLHIAQLDPNAPQPYVGLSFIYWQRAFLGLSNDRDAEVQRAFDSAQQCLLLDPRDPQGHWSLGRALQLRNEIEQSLESLETAVELNPSSIMGLYSLGRSQTFLGQPEPSIRLMEQARRLSPFDPMTFAIVSVHGMNLLRLDRSKLPP